jgi:hypothetical protein
MRAAKPGKDNGKAKIEALISDEETEPAVFGGDFRQELLAGNVFLSVSDAGTFGAVLNIGGCLEGGTGILIRCVQSDLKAIFRLTRESPVTYDMTLNLKNLTLGDTGPGPLVSPITVTLFQPMDFYHVERGGSISQICSVNASGTALKCSEPLGP